MKILHINLSPPGKGGIERLLVDFFDCLHGDEFEISLCILGGDSEVARQLAARGCRCWYLQRRAQGIDWGLYGRLTNVLRAYRPDVVHLHGYAPLVFGAPAARWLGLRNLVHTCHASVSHRGWWRHALLGGLLRLVPKRIAVSAAARQLLVEKFHVPADSIQVIYNGVDLERFANPTLPATANDTPVIGFCGVFRPEKQIPVLIEAFARLRHQGQRARLLLVGNGSTMTACQQAAEQHGVSADITFAGEQIDVRPFLQQMDIFVLPSNQEAMPVALLEAMALGKPVVASNVGGIPEIVADGVSGLLTPSGDVAGLTLALQRLLQDLPLRQRLGATARQQVVERFSLQRMMAEYGALYRTMVSSPAAGTVMSRILVESAATDPRLDERRPTGTATSSRVASPAPARPR